MSAGRATGTPLILCPSRAEKVRSREEFEEERNKGVDPEVPVCRKNLGTRSPTHLSNSGHKLRPQSFTGTRVS